MITPSDELWLLKNLDAELARRVQSGWFAADELKGVAKVKLMINELRRQSQAKKEAPKCLNEIIPQIAK